MKEDKKDYRLVYLLFGLLLAIDLTFIIIVAIATYGITRPIEIGGNIECNSGNIGINFESNYELSNSKYSSVSVYNNSWDNKTSTSYYTSNNTGYDLVPKIFNIKGIDNLNCKVSFNAKGTSSDLLKIIQGGN